MMKQWLYWVELDAKIATTPRLLPELVKRFRAPAPVIAMLNAPLQKNGAQKNPLGITCPGLIFRRFRESRSTALRAPLQRVENKTCTPSSLSSGPEFLRGPFKFKLEDRRRGGVSASGGIS